MSRVAFPLAVLLLAACGSRSTPPATGPDARPTVEVWKEDLEDNSNSSVLMARNDGTTPVTITEVRLTVCDNLYQNCGLHAPNVRVEPGQTVRVMRLDPSNHSRRPRFGWEYRWRGVPTAVQATAIEVPRQVVIGNRRLSPAELVDVESLRLLVPADDANGQCGRPPRLNAGAGFRAYMMYFGPKDGVPTRTATVHLDGAGNPIQYSEQRGDLRVRPDGVASVADPGARTDISVDVMRGMVLVVNVPPGGSPDYASAQATDPLRARSLGRPITTIERMIRECAGR